MAFSKKPTQPPIFDAASSIKGLNASWAAFPEWKRWVEATGTQDTKGMRDVLNANAYALDAVKSDVDGQQLALADLASRISALESQPHAPFPASS